MAEDADQELPNDTGVSSEEQRLFEINHELKSTLTDLLNCETVRKDNDMRLWVQRKLMDAQLAQREQRRRRLTPPSLSVNRSYCGEERPSSL